MHSDSFFKRYLSISPLLPAPMCGYSDRPFRELLRHMGAGLVYTEMFSSEAMIRGDSNTWSLMDFRNEEPPVAVQVFGFRPAAMAEAARIAERHGAAVVDVNLGCPARKVMRADCGAALLESPSRVKAICRAMRRAIQVPLTVKMRWHPDNKSTLEIARICEGEGVNALTLHGRTPKQGYSGQANWDWIRQLKQTVSIPVIGNGDVLNANDLARMMKESGCDAVMVGRGLVGNPWMIQETLHQVHGQAIPGFVSPPSKEMRLETLLRHAELLYQYDGAHGLIEFRKHCAMYIKGLPGARSARVDLMQATTLEQIRSLLDLHFSDSAEDASSECSEQYIPGT